MKKNESPAVKKPRGQPPKEPEERHDVQETIRFNQNEYDHIDNCFTRSGMQSRSKYFAGLILSGCGYKKGET
jgi:hypothetical protein